MKFMSVVLLASCFMVEVITISQEEFNAAATKNGFRTPPQDYYKYFVEASKYSKDEQPRFLPNFCTKVKDFILPKNRMSKTNWGRWFIQLTWGSNYNRASDALGLGKKLFREPQLAGNDKKLAMLVSIWSWDTNVKPRLKGKENQFGVTTSAIDSSECRYPKYRPRAENRWKIYLKVAEALGITNKAKESGCYK